jgi:hypothetical protein
MGHYFCHVMQCRSGVTGRPALQALNEQLLYPSRLQALEWGASGFGEELF